METIISFAVVVVLITALCVQGARYQIQERKLIDSEKENAKLKKRLIEKENKIDKLSEAIKNI